MSLTKATYSMIEGAPINVSDFGAVGDGVTDDTAAIRAAVDYAQSISSVPAFPHVSKQPVIVFAPNKTYKVLGNNVLGHNYAVSGTNGTTYQIDLCGSQLEWHQTGLNDALVDYAAYIFNFGLLNGSVVVVNDFNTSTNGYLVSANPQNPAVSNVFIRHVYDNLKVRGGDYKLKRVFNISGATHCDQTTVSNSYFIGWETFYYSSNPEAVDWEFNSCSMFPDVENFKFFYHENQWSGGMRVIGCELGSRTTGVIFYSGSSSPITTSNNGYVYCNSRLETGGTGKTVSIVDANHGRYEIVGMNFFAGGGANNPGRSAVIRGAAEVTFRKCVLPSEYTVLAETLAEYVVSHANGLVGQQLLFDDCIFENGELVPRFVDSGGTGRTFRYCLENGLVTPVAQCVNCVAFNGASGIGYGVRAANKGQICFQIVRAASGKAYLASYPAITSSIKLLSYSIITSIKVYFPALPGSITDVGVFFGSTLTALVSVSASAVSNTAKEMIPSGKLGIAIPFDMSAPQATVWFAGMNAGSPVTADIEGWAIIEYENIQGDFQMPPADAVTLL